MKKLAIVGAGIAGLGCAYKLRNDFDVTIFESNDFLGGHANTLDVVTATEAATFDSGFMVFNKQTYPHLLSLFAELGVAIKKTDMSFSVQYLPDGVEWNGAGLSKVFAQRKNLFSPRFWRMLVKLDWFNKNAYAQLEDQTVAALSIGEYVKKFDMGDDFLNWYLIPMGGAVWSTPPDKMKDFPMSTLIRFFHNHGFLGLDTHFQWYTVDGGARNYVRLLTAALGAYKRIDEKVLAVHEKVDTSTVVTASGNYVFDKVVLACHADQALALLDSPTPVQKELLSPFEYQSNNVTVHTDLSVMPQTSLAWASWNYRVEKKASGTAASTHYWMNSLQGLTTKTNFFVSLNSRQAIADEHVLRELVYEHPLFNLATEVVQQRLPELNNRESQSTYFCGSYFRYGFHEDALLSAINLSATILASNKKLVAS